MPLAPRKRQVRRGAPWGAARIVSKRSPGMVPAKAAQVSLGTKKRVTPESRKAADLRDRYATLLIQGHDRLRAAVAAVSSYRKAAEIVGPLARPQKRKVKSVPATPDEPVINPS